MKKTISRFIACMLVSVPVVFALAQSTVVPVCFKTTWYNTTQTTTGGCGVSYTVCPGRVLCGPGGDDWPSSAIAPAIVTCRCFMGGEDGPNGCEGGTEIIPCTTVTGPIPNQSCQTSCYQVIVPR